MKPTRTSVKQKGEFSFLWRPEIGTNTTNCIELYCSSRAWCRVLYPLPLNVIYFEVFNEHTTTLSRGFTDHRCYTYLCNMLLNVYVWIKCQILSFWIEVALMHIPYTCTAGFINRNQRIELAFIQVAYGI